MHTNNRAWMISAFIGLLLGSISCCSEARASGAITEINVTPDCKRISVRADGQIGRHAVFALENPNRLVLDIEDTGVSRESAISGTIAAGLEIRAARKGSGARVVMNFGNRPVPEHRVRTVGNYLLLFMEGWAVPAGASSRTPAYKEKSPEPQPRQEPVLSSSPDLQIKSAEVANGLIVLKVANRAYPERIFKIELGVDFDQLGFSAASIHPLAAFSKNSVNVPRSATTPSQPQDNKSGPRKALNRPDQDASYPTD
jgi:hypothetical protein